ncbi:MAG: hypothetical protein R3E61_00125 [Pseudomonadales bacterium]
MKFLEILAKVMFALIAAIGLLAFLLYYKITHPQWESEITSGNYESFEIGLEKREVMELLVKLVPLDPRGWIKKSKNEHSRPIRFISQYEKEELLKVDKWYVNGIVGMEHCEMPDSTLYFSSGHLSKIEIKCWMKK